MQLTTSPIELVTSSTDMILSMESAVALIYLRLAPTNRRWRVALWSWVLGLAVIAALLGTVSHGVEIQPSLRAALWGGLYLSLAAAIGLFLAGAVGDWAGGALAVRLVPWCIGMAVAVSLEISVSGNLGIIVFRAYEIIAIAVVLTIYSFLAITRRLRGAGAVAVAIILNLAAAATQASTFSSNFFVPFDHNGCCHLLQMAAIAILALGLRMGMETGAIRENGGQMTGIDPARRDAANLQH